MADIGDARCAQTPGSATRADPALPRLKTRAQFQSVLSHATRARTAHFALHMLPLSGSSQPQGDAQPLEALFPAGGVWLGAMTPKRWARRAVTRNAIRRQIYALALAEGPPPAAQADVAWVVRLRAEFDRKTFVSASSDSVSYTHLTLPMSDLV